MVIRDATPDDAAEIARIHVRAWQAAYRGLLPQAYLDGLSIERRAAGWRERLAHPVTRTWIAALAGEALGWISVGPARDADLDPRTAELWAIYVDPQRWRAGIGHALWGTAAQHLASTGFGDIVLWVFRANARALAFYRSIGFAPEVGVEKTVERGGIALAELRLRARIHVRGDEATAPRSR